MIAGKSFLLKIWALAIVLLLVSEAVFAQKSDAEIREQVIQELVTESRQEDYNQYNFFTQKRKVILRGYWDAETRKFKFTNSSKEQLIEYLRIRKLPIREQEEFLNARNLALAGLSAGGIIYFVPKKNMIFWETEEDEQISQEIRNERLLTNPLLGNLLSTLLSQVQKEAKEKSFVMMILNPASALAQQIGKARGNKNMQGLTEISTVSPIPEDEQFSSEHAPTNYIGLTFTFRF